MLKTNIQYLFIRLLKDLTVSYIYLHTDYDLSGDYLCMVCLSFFKHLVFTFLGLFIHVSQNAPRKKRLRIFFILERDRKWECSNIKYCSNIVVDVLWSGNENYLKSKHSPLYSLVSTLLAISCEISRSGISKFPWQCQVAYNKMIDSQHLRERAILL